MTVITAQQSAALKLIVGATLAAIKDAGPQGAPAGVLYAAMSAHGCKKEQFDSLMHGLVSVGAIERDGLVYRMKRS
jgi:hypothetical protein